jgi:hypothetical protein
MNGNKNCEGFFDYYDNLQENLIVFDIKLFLGKFELGIEIEVKKAIT